MLLVDMLLEMLSVGVFGLGSATCICTVCADFLDEKHSRYVIEILSKKAFCIVSKSFSYLLKSKQGNNNNKRPFILGMFFCACPSSD